MYSATGILRNSSSRLHGYKFKETEKIDKYHPDVKVYEVYENDGKLLGILYADFFYRDGKSPGAWMTEFRGETKDDNGNKNIPLISIVCNFSKPVGNNPVLLTPYEVETFLHEFGHALHGLSSEAKYASLSGTNVDHDFVELFSQFNENYLTEKEYLDGFAKHYETGKKMPQDLIDRFVKSAQFGAAYACMRNFINFDTPPSVMIRSLYLFNYTVPLHKCVYSRFFTSELNIKFHRVYGFQHPSGKIII